MATETMSSVDAAWLHMDRPTNLMVVTTIAWTEQPVEHDALTDLLQERLVDRFRRFGQRVEDPLVTAGIVSGPRWVDDPTFSITDHVHTSRLPDGAGLVDVQEIAGELASHPLPADRPLWELHVLTGLGHGCALVLRTHQVLADGTALVQVLETLTDTVGPGGRKRRTEVREELARRRLPGLVSGSAGRMVRAGVTGRRWSRRLLGTLTDPASARGLLGEAGRDAAMLRKLGFGLNPPRNVLQGPLGAEKRLGWTRPVPLAAVKQAGRASGRTVNDVVLAVITQALREYLHEHGDDPDEVVVIVPVELRRSDQPLPSAPGNRLGLVFVSLPTGEPDPESRAATVKLRMDRIKASREGVFIYTLLMAMGQLPRGMETMWVDAFARKATAIVTNMTGPPEQVRVAGVPVAGAMAWVPVTGPVGLGLSILSYAGQLSVGLAADVEVLPDPERLLALLEDALTALFPL